MLDYLIMPVYGIIAGLLASIPLGPIGVLCIQRTLSCSRRSGFISGLGAATADTCFAALAIFALSWITGFIEKYQLWVEALGGLLVAGFGIALYFKKATVASPNIQKTSNGSKHLANYFSVLFLTLPNPAYFFVFVTIFAAMGVGIDANLTQKWLIILGVIIGAGGWWFTLTSIISIFRKKFTERSLRLVNKISGGAIALLGAYAVLSVVYQLITTLIKAGEV